MSSSWGNSWSRSWADTWGVIYDAVSSHGKRLKGYLREPERFSEAAVSRMVKAAYVELVENNIGVEHIVAPYRVPQGINWKLLLADTAAIKGLVKLDIRLKKRLEDDAEEEEALILLLSY